MELKDWLGIEERVLPAMNRKMGFANASVKRAWLDGEDPGNSPWLVLCNMRVGESFVIGEGRWTMEQMGKRQCRLRNGKGKSVTLNPRRDGIDQRWIIREVGSLLEFGDEAGDLRRALARDPLFRT